MRPISALRRYVVPRLWFMPVVGAVAAVIVSFVTLTLDDQLTGVSIPIFGAAPAQIASVFAVIATSILNLLALVFTILIVVLQLTSSQYSHRALRTLLQDQQSRITLGIFVATYMHSLIVLAALGTASRGERVAGFSMLSTFTLAIVSIVAFLLFIDHVAQSIRVTSIITSIGSETRVMIERMYPDPVDADRPADPAPRASGPASEIVYASEAGILNRLDAEQLLQAACDSDCEIHVLRAVGDFVPSGSRLIAIHGSSDALDDITDYVELGPDRLMEQDVGFGLRQLVDVAERALSPGTNDPTIAVHAIDQLHDLLRMLVGRRLATGAFRDGNGTARLFLPARRWEDFVGLAVDEIRHVGGHSIQVTRRLRAMLVDLIDVAPRERVAPLREQLELLDAAVARNFPEEADRERARRPDLQGQGFSDPRPWARSDAYDGEHERAAGEGARTRPRGRGRGASTAR
ncbi:MAG: DUF2254 domain-containing protein [Thermoleophilia bacterium]|nr:DUF2254 domain-containing protein [Thermoleophilia bacterium]